MKPRLLLLLSLGLALHAHAALASDRQKQQPQASDFFGFFQMHSDTHHSDYCYGDESCEAPHAGFDPHGNGVHPPLGASDGP